LENNGESLMDSVVNAPAPSPLPRR